MPLRWGDRLPGILTSALTEEDVQFPGTELLLWPWKDGGFSAWPAAALARANVERGWRGCLRPGERVVLRGDALASPWRRPGFHVGLVEGAGGSLLAPGGTVPVSVSICGQQERIAITNDDVVCKFSLFRALVARTALPSFFPPRLCRTHCRTRLSLLAC